jgi:hypothetical protein
MRDKNTRYYPTCCLSAYCGRGRSECGDCANLPRLREFEEWKERTAAVCVDPIWCRTLYRATREAV